MAVQHQQGNTQKSRQFYQKGVAQAGKEVGSSRTRRMRMAPEKEFRALVRIAATLQALCLLAVFGVTDVFAQSTNPNGLASFTLNIVGNGAVTSNPPLSCNNEDGICGGEFPRGTVVRLRANPGDGQILSGWRGACVGKKVHCRVRLRSSKQVVATFAPPPLIPIRVLLRGGGTVESSHKLSCAEGECTGAFPRGTVVHLKANPHEGQILSRWRGACGGSKTQCRVRLRNKPQRVLAVFRTPALIPLRVFLQGEGTVASEPTGLECSNQVCRGRFPQGFPVTLHAKPNENNSFNRWRGACRGGSNEECTVNMKQPRNVLARFSENPPNVDPALTVKIEGIGALSVSPGTQLSVSPGDQVCSNPGCEMKFPPNTSVTLAPKLVEGQEFAWGGACEGKGSEACSVTLTTSLEVAAAFGPPPPPPDVTLILSLVGRGSVISDPPGIDCNAGTGTCTGKFKPETTVFLTATPGVGHEFGEWSAPLCPATLVCSVKLTNPVEEVTATFVMLTSTLSVEAVGEGMVTSEPKGITCPPSNNETCLASYPFGQTVTLVAHPNEGHTLQSWSQESCSVSDTCEVKLGAASTEVTATFKPLPVALNVVIEGNGTGTVTSTTGEINCLPTCTASFDVGSMVTLTATPTLGTGHTFDGWRGGSCSGTSACTVTLAVVTTVTATFGAPSQSGLTRGEAIRFLEQATWGPNGASIAHLMDVGKSAFLAEQFAEPFQGTSSVYPMPDPNSNSLSPLHEQWFSNAFIGEDQLRQRVAFALSQLFVVSANTVGNDEQMIPYQKMLHENAFVNFRELMEMVTLSPTMGRFLDMVNNDKTEPGSGQNPNENYAREILQLFTVGTTLLNIDGTPKLINGQSVQPYDNEVIINLSKVFTGWTYPTKPNETLQWRNPSHYVGEMEAVDAHHDMTAKVLMRMDGDPNGPPIPDGVLPMNQSAQEDLEAALDHIFNHPNVGPFVATRLIRNLVTSNPSPGYIQRVAEAFNNGNGRGDMQAVITAILTDPEAATVVVPHGGHLREPILYAIAVLRALNATVVPDNDLFHRTRDMGQALFSPPSVFNYFSPLYIIPGTTPPLFGPEYQIHNLSSAITRVNFVDRVVNNQVGGVTVDWSAFEAVAGSGNEDLLIDAVAQTLLHEPLTQEERDIIRTSLVNTNGTTAQVRAAVYLIATSGKYQVQH